MPPPPLPDIPPAQTIDTAAGLTMTPQHLEQLAAARMRAKPIRRAISVALFDAWGTGIFGALTLLFGFMSLSGIVMGLGMCAIAFTEFKGAARLKRLDPSATRMLAINQVFFGALLIGYGIFSLLTFNINDSSFHTMLNGDAQLQSMMGSMDDLTRLIARCVYGVLIAVGLFAQGSMALYYRSRGNSLKRYLADTPQWITRMNRAAMPL